MLKFMYFAKRKPGFTPETFTPRWRQHGALAMSLPMWNNMALYIQADTIRPVPIAGASSEYDGFSYAVARDERLFTNPSPDDTANVQRLLNDELETFEAPIPPVLMFVDDEILKKGAPGGVTACLAFKDLGKAETIAKAYASKPKASRVVLNRVREDMKMADMKVSYTATVEISAADVDSLKSVLDVDGAPWRKADLAVVAREAILYNKISEKAA
jgi:hypothetical protein